MNFEPEHLSYSSLAKYEGCPRSYYLSKVRKAEELPAWYFMTGSAIHDGIEIFLKTGEKKSTAELFYPHVEKGLKIEPNMSLWLAAGSKDDPVVEDRAEAHVAQCLERAYEWLEGIEVWAVESDITGRLPGCEKPIKAFPDIIGEHEEHGPSIVDWKSGSSKPKSPLQLETYKALLMVNPELADLNRASKGIWVMLKDGTPKARPIDLTGVDPVALGKRYQEALEKIRQGIFPTNSGFMCNYCEQNPNCNLVSGPNARTLYYDKVIEDGGYPF